MFGLWSSKSGQDIGMPSPQEALAATADCRSPADDVDRLLWALADLDASQCQDVERVKHPDVDRLEQMLSGQKPATFGEFAALVGRLSGELQMLSAIMEDFDRHSPGAQFAEAPVPPSCEGEPQV